MRKLDDAWFQVTIIRITDSLIKVSNGPQALQSQGVSGFIRAVEEDKDRKVEDRRSELKAQEEGNQQLIDAIQDAQR